MIRVNDQAGSDRLHEAAQVFLDVARATLQQTMGDDMPKDANIAARSAMQLAVQSIAQADLRRVEPGHMAEVEFDFASARIKGIADGLGFTLGALAGSGPLFQTVLVHGALTALTNAVETGTREVLKMQRGRG